MINTDLLFISTGSDAKLLKSLIASISGNTEGVKVYLLIVNQGPSFKFENKDPFLEIQILEHGAQISLSAARNIALKQLFKEEVRAKHLMFPDDDTSFRKDFFLNYSSLSAKAAYLAKIINTEDGKDYRKYPQQKLCGRKELIPWVASVSLVLPYKIVCEIGFFDPKLGVGAKWGSSEDLDYFLRASQKVEFCFLPDLKTCHPSRFGKYWQMKPSQIRNRFKAYTDGYLAVYYRYDLESKLGLFATRALGGAFISLLKLKPQIAMQYLWLFSYRLQAKAYFRKIKHEDPEKLALEYEF